MLFKGLWQGLLKLFTTITAHKSSLVTAHWLGSMYTFPGLNFEKFSIGTTEDLGWWTNRKYYRITTKWLVEKICCKKI